MTRLVTNLVSAWFFLAVWFCIYAHAQVRSVYQKAEVCLQTINKWRISKHSVVLEHRQRFSCVNDFDIKIFFVNIDGKNFMENSFIASSIETYIPWSILIYIAWYTCKWKLCLNQNSCSVIMLFWSNSIQVTVSTRYAFQRMHVWFVTMTIFLPLPENKDLEMNMRYYREIKFLSLESRFLFK